MVGLVLAAVQFLPGFFARGLESLYVSSWYILGALVFTLLAYPMGNIVPELVAGRRRRGLQRAVDSRRDRPVRHAAGAGRSSTSSSRPPRGRPIYSHFLSMLGFWLLFFLYPLNGTHHYVFSVIPMAAQMGAIAASTLLGVTVVIVVTNLFLSLRGAGILPRDPGLRFVATGTLFYLIVSVQGASQAQMAVNQAVHFTDWVIGHSHLAMLGFASFAAIGGLVHAWQRIPVGALQRARHRPCVLAAGGGTRRHGVRPDDRGAAPGPAVAVGRAVDRVGGSLAAVLAGAHAVGRSRWPPDSSRCCRG